MLPRHFDHPPRGWNSYDTFDTTVTEKDILEQAAILRDTLLPYGYDHVVVDIQWYAAATGTMRDQFQYIPFSTLSLDAYGRLQPDPEKFPSAVSGRGFRDLADQIHAMGLKFGIHIMRGIPRIAAQNHLPILGSSMTADMVADPSSICGWNPDMYGVRNCEAGQAWYNSIISQYAEWGVDFIKCDDICNTNLYASHFVAPHEIEMLRRAIDSVDRPITLSLSPGPALLEKSWFYRRNANMWRITDDFWDEWEPLKTMFSVCERWQDHVHEGGYPDCDMLPLGYVGKGFRHDRKTSFTADEQKTMMTLWCLFRSPLMLGADMTRMDDDTLKLLTCRELLVLEGEDFVPCQLEHTEDAAIWLSSNGKDTYVALFNLSDTD
ncbi:MAG: glycoside hydrolase family 27 protein, partial [Clostridia bacterium]|nr:glycoside hydrolase family 27 protein [Clostridia bacterium]